MIRFIYACLLRMHPARFRRRFGEEMLWIFDEAAAERRTAPLFADAVLSLWRQWTLRSEFWHQPDTANRVVPDGVPVFYVGEGDTPRTGALIHGEVRDWRCGGSTGLPDRRAIGLDRRRPTLVYAGG